jgi:hypothetical protein
MSKIVAQLGIFTTDVGRTTENNNIVDKIVCISLDCRHFDKSSSFEQLSTKLATSADVQIFSSWGEKYQPR